MRSFSIHKSTSGVAMSPSKAHCLCLLLLHASLAIAALHGSSAAQLPVTAGETGRTLQRRSRLRRKAAADTSSPVQYMIQLRESLTDSSGKPRTETEDPTNVWCLLDKGKIRFTRLKKHPTGFLHAQLATIIAFLLSLYRITLLA